MKVRDEVLIRVTVAEMALNETGFWFRADAQPGQSRAPQYVYVPMYRAVITIPAPPAPAPATPVERELADLRATIVMLRDEVADLTKRTRKWDNDGVPTRSVDPL